jgi:hypothetical protein
LIIGAIGSVVLFLALLTSAAKGQDKTFPRITDPNPGKFYELATDAEKDMARQFLLAVLTESINLPDGGRVYALGGGNYKPLGDEGAYGTWQMVAFVHNTSGSQCAIGMLQTVEKESIAGPPTKLRFSGFRQAGNENGKEFTVGGYALLAGDISRVKGGEVTVQDPFKHFKKLMNGDERLKTCAGALSKLGNDFKSLPR